MTQPQADYKTETEEALEMLGKGYENAAEIHPPKTIHVIREKGLEEYKVWGWVKVSAKFLYHIKKLKGAKLAIWQVIALSIDESGECNLSINDIAELSGYSYAETHESLKELDEMEYLSISREKGRKSMYSPNFAARGNEQPTENPSSKWRGTYTEPLQPTGGDPSSPAIEIAHSSIKELKELMPLSLENAIAIGKPVTNEMINTAKLKDTAPKMFEKALGFTKPLPWWDGDKNWRELGEWVCAEYEQDRMSFGRYNIWRNTKYTKGGLSNNRLRGFPQEFYDSWDMFKMSEGENKKTDETRPEYSTMIRTIGE